LGGVFQFCGFFISKYIFKEFGIGNTVAKWVQPEFITLHVILAGIIAAIIWNLITWWFGIPSSSSHTLMGGFVGAHWPMHMGSVMMQVSCDQLRKSGSYFPVYLFCAVDRNVHRVLYNDTDRASLQTGSNPYRAENWFKKLQLVSSAAFSLGHGGNDAQKVMGIIGAAVIYYEGTKGNHMDFDQFVTQYAWVPFTSFLAIGLGTMSGGWKIVKTMGTRITKVTPLEGVAAETAGAITLFLTEHFKIPVSTTHTITGSIIGVGATKRLSAVRWGVTVNLLWAWILTIPILLSWPQAYITCLSFLFLYPEIVYLILSSIGYSMDY
jgi:PiT family inorganic phosphate transporter